MPPRVVSVFFTATLAISVFGQTAPPVAKPDTSQEAVVYQRIRNLVRFENDGTGIRDTTATIRVQSQAGVQEMGQLILGYTSATENLQIEYVRVRKPDGRTVETTLSGAQDFAPDVLREAPMYSDYRERHVSVSDLRVGDVLEYHVVTQVKPLAPGEFWYEHSFPKQAAVEEETLELDIPKSREVKLKSPKHKFETRETEDRRVYSWSIQGFIPDRRPDRSEDEDDDSDFGPDVQITTFTGWPEVAHWYAKLQGERAAADESVRKKATELIQGATTPVEKTRRLYDYVARNIRYVSLSFGTGRLQPHAASEVLQNGYGDCKDKHTLLEALLHAEGIKSYPVMIHSYRKLDADIPSPAQFDHVITAVPLGKDGELTWLDTTTEVAPYGLIMYQLRNKQALLASEGAIGGLRRTSAETPVKSRLVTRIDGKYTEIGALDAMIEMTAQGDSDWPLRAIFRIIPQTDWPRILQRYSDAWGLAGEIADVHIDAIEDTSKPFHMTYHLHRDNYFRVPSTGINFGVLPPVSGRRLGPAGKKKQAEPIDVGPAEERVYQAHIQIPPNYAIHIPGEVRMVRDFGEYSSSYTLTKNVLEAERRVVLKVNELPPTRRADYQSFLSATSSAVEQGLWCTITRASAEAVASAGQATGTPAEMRKAATAALERRDFGPAASLLQRSLEQDPKQKNAWDDLGLAYAGLNQHDDAVAAFRKQIELDPYHSRANGDLASELLVQGKQDEALAAYKKQAEITPSDKLAHKNLGLLLVQMKRDQEARAELETASSIAGDDPQVKMALAQVYARTGNSEQAQALMKSVTGVSTGGAGDDMFSSALSDKADPDEAIHDARQTLADIGGQFESGEYDHLGASAFSAMNLVALAWARMGWAKFQQGTTLESMQFMNAAWMLSQSGTVGNRLARVYEKENQRDKARHMFALAVAAGGAEAQGSREALLRLSASAEAADKEVAQAKAELLQMRTVKLSGVAGGTSARFALVFDGESKPERAQYLDGDTGLRSVADKLREKEYGVRFPDVSSVKIVRRATLSCAGSECSLVLQPLEGLQP
jgi:tetratricopeptide (TPR) repeat protein